MSTNPGDDQRTFRDRALDRMRAKLGEPRPIPTGEGRFFYRWILERPHGLSIYVTLDSPEIQHLAHLLVSDPRAAVNPIQTITMRTFEEVDEAVKAVLAQWQG